MAFDLYNYLVKLPLKSQNNYKLRFLKLSSSEVCHDVKNSIAF